MFHSFTWRFFLQKYYNLYIKKGNINNCCYWIKGKSIVVFSTAPLLPCVCLEKWDCVLLNSYEWDNNAVVVHAQKKGRSLSQTDQIILSLLLKQWFDHSLTLYPSLLCFHTYNIYIFVKLKRKVVFLFVFFHLRSRFSPCTIFIYCIFYRKINTLRKASITA